MSPADLLSRLTTEGIRVLLNLKLKADEKPSEDTIALIRDNRNALLDHLAYELIGIGNERPSTSVTLHGDLLLNLLVWAARHQELRLHHQGGFVLNARPEHIVDAAESHPWGLVFDIDRRVLVSWGDVPVSALLDKRNLDTNEPLVREAEVA